eukprot:tig00001299_g8066.t1
MDQHAAEQPLPRPILVGVLRRLAPVDLIRCGGVSKEWRAVCLSSDLWRSISAADAGGVAAAVSIARSIREPEAVETLDLQLDERDDFAGAGASDDGGEAPGPDRKLHGELQELVRLCPNASRLLVSERIAMEAAAFGVLLAGLGGLRALTVRVDSEDADLDDVADAIARVAPALEELALDAPLEAGFLARALRSGAGRVQSLEVDANARGGGRRR